MVTTLPCTPEDADKHSSPSLQGGSEMQSQLSSPLTPGSALETVGNALTTKALRSSLHRFPAVALRQEVGGAAGQGSRSSALFPGSREFLPESPFNQPASTLSPVSSPSRGLKYKTQLFGRWG